MADHASELLKERDMYHKSTAILPGDSLREEYEKICIDVLIRQIVSLGDIAAYRFDFAHLSPGLCYLHLKDYGVVEAHTIATTARNQWAWANQPNHPSYHLFGGDSPIAADVRAWATRTSQTSRVTQTSQPKTKTKTQEDTYVRGIIEAESPDECQSLGHWICAIAASRLGDEWLYYRAPTGQESAVWLMFCRPEGRPAPDPGKELVYVPGILENADLRDPASALYSFLAKHFGAVTET